jgi:D-alanyl-D-alanine carboxypeptidase/D-alanyl-D-alanine-endopeptidase (penicillin-binding protein 4)
VAVVWLAAIVAPAAPSFAAPAPTPDQRLKLTLARELTAAGGRSGAWVADLDTGNRLFGWRESEKRVPASVEKLFTTATALERLGPESRLQTAIAGDGVLDADGTLAGSLYIRGGGDPSFTTARLRRLASAVEAAGVQAVSGDVYGDETYFDRRRGVPASGFAISRWVGPLSALAFNRGIGTGGRFQAHPARFVAARLRAALENRGVEVDGSAVAGRMPAESTELAISASAPLAALVKHTNHVSDNYFAETLLKGLGAQFGTAGSTSAGAAVVRSFERGLGLRSNVVDGSGLSRSNAVSPRTVGRLLSRASESPWFDSFYRSLPLAAHSGTLHDRMRHTAASGRCRAKTGTLNGVSGLAGYCRSRGGDRIAFALLMNGVNIYTARRAQDRIAATLAGYTG